jgi:metal-dependent amidase/aminoacylase/carboxypeptidase family protein
MTSDKAIANAAARGDEALESMSTYVDSLSDELWPVNMTIHNNPELCYEEFVAHETLTAFPKSKTGWTVIPSAYGIATAFAAEYDTGKPGLVVSFNAEYGTYTMRIFTIR